MRTVKSFNKGWHFSKPNLNDVKTVNLPHTWNAEDGQDGGNDYFRGECKYSKKFKKSELPEGEKYYIQFDGANSSARVILNGEELGLHHGGYSTWRVNITENLREDNLIDVLVDNGKSDTVYPQTADFTFYGGLYRKVHVICTDESHFDLENYGGNGLKVTPTVSGNDARVDVEVWVKNFKEEQKLRYTVYDSDGNAVVSADSNDFAVSLFIENVKLWHGRRSPYLYTLKAGILEGDEVVDLVSTKFGCRSFEVDPERGFILNGEEYSLRGVSRHQDFVGIGNALTEHNIYRAP